MIRIKLRGVHIITMQRGKVYSLDVFEESQAVGAGLSGHCWAGVAPRLSSYATCPTSAQRAISKVVRMPFCKLEFSGPNIYLMAPPLVQH